MVRGPTVSVLIPTFNRSRMLGDCVQSVLDQTCPAIQVIVIDDGSTDDTSESVKRFGSRVTYLRKENGGKPAALNLAMPKVVGDLVWIFDDDDVALPNSVERRLRAFESNPKAGAVVSNHIWGDTDSAGRICRTSPHTWPNVCEQNFLLQLMRSCFVTLQGALVRTSCYREVGPFREEFLASEDYEMLIRLARRYPIVLLNEPTFIFRRHAGVRGPAHRRYSAYERQRVFARFDRLLGEQLRRDAPLRDFLTPPVPGPLSSTQQRTATVARMSVMASKGLWWALIDDATAFADFVDRGVGGYDITPSERAQIIGAAQAPYFALLVLSEPTQFVKRIVKLRSSPAGRAILRGFARGLLGVARWGAGGRRERRNALIVASRLAIASLM